MRSEATPFAGVAKGEADGGTSLLPSNGVTARAAVCAGAVTAVTSSRAAEGAVHRAASSAWCGQTTGLPGSSRPATIHSEDSAASPPATATLPRQTMEHDPRLPSMATVSATSARGSPARMPAPA